MRAGTGPCRFPSPRPHPARAYCGALEPSTSIAIRPPARKRSATTMRRPRRCRSASAPAKNSDATPPRALTARTVLIAAAASSRASRNSGTAIMKTASPTILMSWPTQARPESRVTQRCQQDLHRVPVLPANFQTAAASTSTTSSSVGVTLHRPSMSVTTVCRS
jgi:hypothetical protein